MCPFRWQSHSSSSSRKRSKTTASTASTASPVLYRPSHYPNYLTTCPPSMTDQARHRHPTQMGMSLHPPQPLLPLHPISDKSPKQNGIVQPSSPVANLLASASSSCTPPLLPPRLPVQPCCSCRCPCVYVYMDVCMCVRFARALPIRRTQTDWKGRSSKKEQEERRKNENEGEINPPLPFAWGPSMHAGHPSITWGENSPPATVPCVPCAPGSRESVSSHRYHTHIVFPLLCPSVCVSVSVCPILLSIKVRLSVNLVSQDIFGDGQYLALESPPPPLCLSPRRGLVACSSCTHRGGLAHPPSLRGLSGPLLDATVPLAGRLAGRLVLGFCDR